MELVLLDELVQVGRQQLKDKAQVVFVDERVPESKDVMLVVWVALLVELCEDDEKISGRTDGRNEHATHQFEYCHLHHTLVEVRGLVLHDLHCDYFMRLHVLAFHHLPERSLPQNIENQISAKTDYC